MSDNEEQIDSGVEGINADDTYQKLPVFDVESDNFFNNMRKDRNKMNFPDDSKVSKFMKGTDYRLPFYMRHKGPKGEMFLKKVK